jgi:micrococcal nuclease
MSKKIVQDKERTVNLSKKLIIVPAAFLIGLLSVVGGTKYEKEIRQMLSQPTANKPQSQIRILPSEGTVERVIDGDTVVLADKTIIRYVGINAPNKNEKYYEEAKEANRKMVEGKKVKLEYDAYTSDAFGRVLAYVWVGDKNMSIEMVRLGWAKVELMQDRRPLKYQEELQKI